MNISRPDWNDYFADMAILASGRSTCNSSKVGAVIVKDRRVVSTGYNGSLAGRQNCCDEPGRCVALERPGKKYDHCPAVHAEANAVAQAALHGVPIRGASIYVTRRPCLICAKLLAAAGIHYVYTVEEESGKERRVSFCDAHRLVMDLLADGGE